jgi:hypothetical protein
MLQAVGADPTISYAAADVRNLVDGLVAYPGVVRLGDLKVTQRAAGANMSVDVAAGSVFIDGSSVALQGCYFCKNTAAVNVPIAAAPGSGTRTDLIVARVYDKQADGGTLYTWALEKVTGTVGAGTPAAPVSSALLATVTVAAGNVSIVNAAISEAVKQYATSISSTAVVADQSHLPASPRQGDSALELDTGISSRFSGVAWQRTSPAYTGFYYGTTDAGGSMTVPLPATLGYTPRTVIAGVMSPVMGGAGPYAMSVTVDLGNITAAWFKCRLWTNIAGAVTATVAYTVAP